MIRKLRWIKNAARAAAALGLLLAGVWTPQARADDAPLLELLRQKRVLTQQEFDRLQGTELAPPQRAGLIDLLRDKGVLTKDEASALQQPAAVAKEEPVPPAAAGEPKVPTAPQLGYDEGFFVRTPDGAFSLKFNGRVAGNFFFFEPDTVQSNTATVDRGRLSADATFYKYFRLRLENDFAFSSGLRDAFLAFNYSPAFNMQIGQYKIPFSYEELLSKKYIDFVERAAVVSSTVNPSRDIGVMVYGTVFDKLLQYQLAGMNGSGQNRSDNNSDKDIVARAVVSPFPGRGPAPLRGFNVGGAMTYGREAREAVRQGATSTLVANSIAGATATGFTFFPAVPRHGDRLRAGAHAAWLYGPLSLSSEYISTQESRTDLNGADLPDLDTDGAYVGGTWLLTGETKPFNKRVYPAHSLLGAKGPGWGAWEAALRYEYFKLRHDPDGPTDHMTNNRYDALVAGVNWYANEFLRFSLNYLYGNFANRGSGLSPNPDQHSNNAVLGRAQLEF